MRVPSDSDYDCVVNIICELGYIPMPAIDDLYQQAHHQIYDALKVADGTRKDRLNYRNNEIWGGINAERSIYSDIWNDYMVENWDNFEPC